MQKTKWMFTGSYNEPLLQGTGEIVQGKGEGICVYTYDPETGVPEKKSACPTARNSTYLAASADGNNLYAVEELKEWNGYPGGAVVSYRFDRETATLTRTGEAPALGEDTCHLSVSPDGKYLFAANYAGGSLCVYSLGEDGAIGKMTCFLRHSGSGPDAQRQAGPHVHQVLPYGDGKLLASDLGTDEVVIYAIDAERGHLQRTGQLALPPGAGPRHCAIAPSGKRAYVLTEMGNRIHLFSLTGACGEEQSISLLPEEFSGASSGSAIRLHPSGKWLYAANRGHNSIADFAVDPDSEKLSLIGHVPTDGENPRDFAIDPEGNHLLCLNQDTDNLVTYSIDPATGALTKLWEDPSFCTATTLVFI